MDNMFICIDTTVNKSAIHQFKNFLQKYPEVTKWFMCSDYCIADTKKPNDVVSFVLYPYILDFNEWNEVVSSMQKTDLKHCRQVSPSFCDFTKEGYFFSFNFILRENNILRKLDEKASLDYLLKVYIEMTENWQVTTPNNAEAYEKINKKLKKLQNATKQKSFNYKMFGRVIKICFLAGYLRYLLGQFTRNYMQTVKRAADNTRRYAPGWVHSTCLLRGFPTGAAPNLPHDFAEQSVVCYTLCRRCPENTVAAGEGKGI